jgi:acyl-coenzyme A synthetase/AMP-(fatty) acid ligase
VVPSAGPLPTLPELRALVSERLAGYAAPRELRLVSELPTTALGKVRRDVLTAAPALGERSP